MKQRFGAGLHAKSDFTLKFGSGGTETAELKVLFISVHLFFFLQSNPIYHGFITTMLTYIVLKYLKASADKFTPTHTNTQLLEKYAATPTKSLSIHLSLLTHREMLYHV